MDSKILLLHRAFEADTPEAKNKIMRELLDEEMPRENYEITVKFTILREDLIEHKICNAAHTFMTPSQHMIEMIQDCLYDGGPLAEGDFEIIEVLPVEPE